MAKTKLDDVAYGSRARLRENARAYSSAAKEYTSEGEQRRLMADWERKGELAQGVVHDYKKRIGDPKGKTLLDVGFGNGIQSIAFARAGARVTGLEVSTVLYKMATGTAHALGGAIDFRLYDGAAFPFPDDSFDAAYSISVLEHATDAPLLLQEVSRVLKPGGTMYLAFPNRFAPVETHTRYLFLSYFPRGAAEWILRLRGRDTIQELNLHFISYFALRRMLAKTKLRVRFETATGSVFRRVVKKTLAFAGLHHSILLPHIMVVLEKAP